MRPVVEKALGLWGLSGALVKLAAARENEVFKVDSKGESFALRLHRKGYRTDAELRSELRWMAAVEDAGLSVPQPIPSSDGSMLHTIDGVQVDLLTWLDGTPMGQTNTPLQHHDRTGLFHALGYEMARLHEACDGWNVPDEFKRPVWDRNGLLGDEPVWGRFWENPILSDKQRKLFLAVRQRASHDLAAAEDALDYGLIHADLVRENVLIDGEQLRFIDFDDGGYGFRLFDIATTLGKNANEPNFPHLKDALLIGYRSVRDIDTALLDMFMLLRALTYVGWIIPRLDGDGAALRNERNIEMAERLATAYLMQDQ